MQTETPTTRESYAYAEAHECELTPNQRRTLDLIVSGRTNAEIGAALGMTLDGAKWNVSEILTKLGFSSREEAAAYWRWRNRPTRRLSRAMHALFGIPALKLAAGGTGLAVAVVSGVLLVGVLGNDDEPNEMSQQGLFYFEADITVTSHAESVGGDFASDDEQPLPEQEEEIQPSQLKWWMRDETHGRWEICTHPPEQPSPSCYISVADGDLVWLYDEASNTYQQDPLPSGGVLAFAPILSLSLGPTYADDLDGFLKYLDELFAEGATVVGVDRILGRDVTVVEARPVQRSISERTADDGTVTRVESGSGSVRYWLDEERMFIMRYESSAASQDAVATIVELDYPARIPDSVVTFDPPEGADKVASFSEDIGFQLTGTTTGSTLATPTASDAYCSGPAVYQQPWPDVAGAGPTIGPVTAVLPLEIFVAEAGLETGVPHPISLFIDSAAIEAADATAITLRAISVQGDPSPQFVRTGGGEGTSVLTLELELPPDGEPVSVSAMTLLHEPGCHQFEVEIGDNLYGPFALDVITP